ncbi:Clp protease N-terminal domain-containing protein [Streptomyces bluensis]|uniref:Clp protease N-terminal domain-containing protein n=1 Tax=Streptomyces bluensis TaxID=33897 RepID=UPI001E370BFD|nr:Clp protease N-terminal domain-containing protein [Streptomyces bluensis]
MRPRIPRQSAAGHDRTSRDRTGAEPDARLTDELAAVIAGARRRALRDGDRQIDTAHLLHTLLESDPEVRAVFGDGPRIARLLGYLVQRSIGYGLRWQSGVEDSGAVPVLTGVAGWSPVAAGALEGAYGRAARWGRVRARGIDLLAAIIADPESRAVEVLGRAGIAADELSERIEGGQAGRPAGGDAAR